MYQFSSAYEIYQNNQVNTLSSGKLLLMMYDGALKFLRFALIAMEEKDYAKTNKYLLKTQDIISELITNLNYNAGEIANQLHSLYDFMIKELIDANIKKNAEKVKSVYSLIEDLRNTWEQVV